MMEEFFLKTQEIINANYFHQQNGGQLVLQDKDEKGKKLGKPVTIAINRDIVCLELDKKNKSIFQFFKNDVTDLCKIADRILFYSKNEILYVFIVELKTETTGGAIKQVKASYVLSEYVVNTVRRMLDFKEINVQYRGLIFSNKSYKLPTSPKDNFKTIEKTALKYQHLQTGQLIKLDGLV
jgi:hypothetical protein